MTRLIFRSQLRYEGVSSWSHDAQVFIVGPPQSGRSRSAVGAHGGALPAVEWDDNPSPSPPHVAVDMAYVVYRLLSIKPQSLTSKAAYYLSFRRQADIPANIIKAEHISLSLPLSLSPSVTLSFSLSLSRSLPLAHSLSLCMGLTIVYPRRLSMYPQEPGSSLVCRCRNKPHCKILRHCDMFIFF